MVEMISAGMGVQSSYLCMAATLGEITPMPKAAVFADTGEEPKKVYEWINWLEPRLAFPLVRVSIGKLSLAALTRRKGKKRPFYLKPSLPVYFKDAGLGKRQCTMDFKIIPVQRYMNLLRGNEKVSVWLGISTDEASRMRDNNPRTPQFLNRYPLIELSISRTDCLAWFKAHNYPEPPRSACVFCPFHSDDEWLRLKTFEPEDFAYAVQFEKNYQEAAKEVFDSIPYLHESCLPLDQVEFIASEGRGRFGNECQGMCGI